ncbi:Hypothetical protein ACI5QN_05023 [Bacillus cereus]
MTFSMKRFSAIVRKEIAEEKEKHTLRVLMFIVYKKKQLD